MASGRGTPRPVAVDVWVRRPADVPDGRDLLDELERRTLAGLVSSPSAAAYAAAHVLARRAVADVAGCGAAQVRFDRTCPGCTEQHGRPTLPDLPGIHVSLTRTVDLVAVAVTRAVSVGVDVESLDATDFPGFSGTALHPDERPTQEASVDEQSEQRARAWTRKEACLKALGIGLRTDPTQLTTPPDGIPTDVDGRGSWVTVTDVPLAWPGHAAAVAVAIRASHIDVRMR